MVSGSTAISHPRAGPGFVGSFYGIPKKTIAIGDGHNDLDMIAYAGIGVAMRNAHPELLKIADIVTESLDEHGVHAFLKRFFA